MATIHPSSVIHHREAVETAWRVFRQQRLMQGWSVEQAFQSGLYDRATFEWAFERGRRLGVQEERERLQRELPMEEKE